MIYNNIWISTTSHLQKFKELLQDKSINESSPSDFMPPPDFPSMKLFFNTFPVVLVDIGRLEITDSEFIFKAKSQSRFTLRRFLNLEHRDIQFDLAGITKIDTFHHDAYLAESCYFPFIQITTESKEVPEVLLCHGGSGFAVQKIIHRTDELKKLMESKMNNSSQQI